MLANIFIYISKQLTINHLFCLLKINTKKFTKHLVSIEKYRTFATLFKGKGEMAEWSIAAVLKTAVLRGTGGSNPSLSANFKQQPKQ